jgi:hypothetical protein
LTFTYEGMVYRRVFNVTWDYVSEEGCWARAEYNWYPVIPEFAEKGCHYFTYCMNNYWAGVELSNFWDYWHQSPWTGIPFRCVPFQLYVFTVLERKVWAR